MIFDCLQKSNLILIIVKRSHNVSLIFRARSCTQCFKNIIFFSPQDKSFKGWRWVSLEDVQRENLGGGGITLIPRLELTSALTKDLAAWTLIWVFKYHFVLSSVSLEIILKQKEAVDTSNLHSPISSQQWPSTPIILFFFWIQRSLLGIVWDLF